MGLKFEYECDVCGIKEMSPLRDTGDFRKIQCMAWEFKKDYAGEFYICKTCWPNPNTMPPKSFLKRILEKWGVIK